MNVPIADDNCSSIITTAARRRLAQFAAIWVSQIPSVSSAARAVHGGCGTSALRTGAAENRAQ